MFSFDEIVEKIIEEKKIDKNELEKLIEEKQDELSGLVSKEGAAYIVGRELGIDLIKESKRGLKIKNLVAGLGNCELVVKVVRVFEKRNFEKNGKNGQLLSMVIGDDSGITRLTFWNDQVDLVESQGIKEGDAIKISNGWVKEGLSGPEISLGRKGTIEKSDQEVVVTEKPMQAKGDYKRAQLSGISEGFFEVKGCLVSLLERDPLYGKCPECDGKLVKEEDGFSCIAHGKVEPKYNMILSGTLDDGTGNIRVVFFKEVAEKVLGKTVDDVKRMRVDDIYRKFKGLGKDMIVKGRVRKNSYSDENELVASEVEEIDVNKECDLLLEELKT